MVEVHVGDRRHAAIPGMGRIEPTAEADLDDREVDTGIREVAERERGEQLELGRRTVTPGDPVGDRQAVADEAREIVRGDRVTRDPDPFAVGHEMRLRRLPGAIAGGRETRADERDHAALAVGAADERAADPLLGVPESFQQRPGPSEAQADPEPPPCLQRGDRFGEGGREVAALDPRHSSRSSS